MIYSANALELDRKRLAKTGAARDTELAVGTLTGVNVLTKVAFGVAGIGPKSPVGVALTAMAIMAFHKAATDFIKAKERERVARERVISDTRQRVRDRADAHDRESSGGRFDRANDHSVNEGRADNAC